jgi:plastocyanin
MKTRLLALLIFISFSASATIHVVNVSNFQFSPASLSVAVGDTIEWVWISGSHTTTSTNIPAGAQTWNSTISPNVTSFRYEVTAPGTYNYRCTPHSATMTGTFTATSTGLMNVTSPELSVRLSAEKQLTLSLQLPRSVNVDFAVLDVLGRTVAAENRSIESAGIQQYQINVSDLNTGYYFVRLTAGDKVLTRRIYIN